MMLLIGETSLQLVGARQHLKRGTVVNRYFVMGTIVMAAATLAGQAVYAESAAISTTPGDATFKSAKRVSFNMRNGSKMAIKVKSGDNEVVLEPGKVVSMKLEVVVQVVAEETIPNYPSGMVNADAATYLSDSTITLH
jgi:hypothetical protein